MLINKSILRYFLLLILLGVTLPLAAQNTGSISGVVVDLKDSIPLSKAYIKIEETNTNTTVDKNCRYYIADLVPGEYTISVICDGYNSQKNKKVVVIDEEQIRINFYLKMIAAVSGKLVTMPAIAQSTGNISGIVFAEKDSAKLFGAVVSILGTFLKATTDSNGNYLITNIIPGTYSVEVKMIGFDNKTIQSVKILPNKEIMLYILLSEQGLIW